MSAGSNMLPTRSMLAKPKGRRDRKPPSARANRSNSMNSQRAWLTLGILVAPALVAPVQAETIATFTRNPSNPILRGVRMGAEVAAGAHGAQIVHFIPRSEAPPEQIGLVDEVIRNKPDAIVFAPFDPKLMIP